MKMSLTTITATTVIPTKQRIRNWLGKFKIPFDVENKAIDLREMVNNYPGKRIPILDIADGIEAVIGNPLINRQTIDPRGLKKIPKFAWVELSQCFYDPRFQRDVAPNHIKNIEANFDSRMIIVPCAVKFVDLNGVVHFCLWDGGHTSQLLIRQGWTHIPVWYTDVDDLSLTELDEAEEAMIGLAGRSFIRINKTFKRPVGGYDEFMILLETKDVDTVSIFNILKANNCQPYRYKRTAGDVTHFEALWECYELQNKMGMKGVYLARALTFHRKHWPMASIEAEVMRPMTMLYALCDAQIGQMPSAQFDDDLGQYLRNNIGSAEKVQEDIKSMYSATHPLGRDNHPVQVVSGLLLIYNKYINNEPVAAPVVRFNV